MPLKILHDKKTYEDPTHHAKEIIGNDLKPSQEGPIRVKNMLNALVNTRFFDSKEEITITTPPVIPEFVHSQRYITYLCDISNSKDLVPPTVTCLLPRTFPHAKDRSLTLELHPPLDQSGKMGFYSSDQYSGITKETYSTAMAAVNLAIKGVDAIVSDPQARRFCLTRPPSLHAGHELAGGYCYINATAVAVEHLIHSAPGKQVGILDLDFHHGAGTQSIFYRRTNPVYVSIHGPHADCYPYYSGNPLEEGDGPGKGYNLNLPLSPQASGAEYMEKLDTAIRFLKDRWKVEYLVVSLGFDTYKDDKFGSSQLVEGDYQKIGERLHKLNVPTVVLLEGGYHEDIGKLFVKFLDGWMPAVGF